ncbi:DUF4177 domain-containing protein [Solilutibacter silvestris]|uniref:DUF4177 domain-containing protein n=1 Tax=Solilutibacter silvestris TaxID=1645665 RepID=A0A2K1Q3V5_9GAMM|nr:DUF4177 domain-containing protein [Lysobacter silvestris]PNS09718.1 hypothetical protein Lysil_1347 [Lysobacter silvestris]
MSGRWQYKVIEIEITLFSGKLTERMQEELDRMGPQGWELVNTVQANPSSSLRMVFKRGA